MDLPEDVLHAIFTYFKPKELLMLRLTCKTWDSVVSNTFGKCYKITIKTIDDVKKITSSHSNFIRNITALKLSVGQFEDSHKIVYKAMFEYVKPLRALALHNSHAKFASSILCEFTSYFSQLESFVLACSIEREIIGRVKCSDFTSIKNLTLIASGEISDYGQIDFLQKFLQENHHLRSLILKRHFCIGELPLNVITNAFKSKYLEELHIDPQFSLNQDHIMSIIASDSNNLKYLKSMIKVDNHRLYRCLNKYKDSLEKLVLSSYSEISTDYVPILNKLRRLEIEHFNSSNTVNLSFCMKLPALKSLKLGNGEHYLREHFVHRNLELLDLKSVQQNDVNEILRDVPYLFPNLKTIVIKGNANLKFPIELLEARGITLE